MEGIPKNIRQIGGREERIRTYMEDYVNTYLRKLQEEREETGAVGIFGGTVAERRKERLRIHKRSRGSEWSRHRRRTASHDG